MHFGLQLELMVTTGTSAYEYHESEQNPQNFVALHVDLIWPEALLDTIYITPGQQQARALDRRSADHSLLRTPFDLFSSIYMAMPYHAS